MRDNGSLSPMDLIYGLILFFVVVWRYRKQTLRPFF